MFHAFVDNAIRDMHKNEDLLTVNKYVRHLSWLQSFRYFAIIKMQTEARLAVYKCTRKSLRILFHMNYYIRFTIWHIALMKIKMNCLTLYKFNITERKTYWHQFRFLLCIYISSYCSTKLTLYTLWWCILNELFLSKILIEKAHCQHTDMNYKCNGPYSLFKKLFLFRRSRIGLARYSAAPCWCRRECATSARELSPNKFIVLRMRISHTQQHT